jgi:hypothetical protein
MLMLQELKYGVCYEEELKVLIGHFSLVSKQ